MKKSKWPFFPIWEAPINMLITRKSAEGKPSHEWRADVRDGKEMYSLVAKLEITGCSGAFLMSPEDQLEVNRCAAWHNAILFAEVLFKKNPHRSYVVMFHEDGKYNTGEAVRIYWKLGVSQHD